MQPPTIPPTQLTLINNSQETSSHGFVLFERNTKGSNPPIAWQVVRGLAVGDRRTIALDVELEGSAIDDFGNQLMQLTTNLQEGTAFRVVRGSTGNVIEKTNRTVAPGYILVANELPTLATNPHPQITAQTWRSGLLLASWPAVARGDAAEFGFDGKLRIGAANDLTQGAPIRGSINGLTELDVGNVLSADIIVTGAGTDTAPFVFTLENTVYR